MIELTEDFLAPLTRYLRADPRILELNTLVPTGGVNPVLGAPAVTLNSSGVYVPYSGPYPLWIFRGFQQSGAPYANVEGTGTSSITLEHTGSWGGGNRGNFLQFPEITVYYHCDVTRDSVVGAPIALDARDKCLTLHKEVTRLLHLVDKGTGGYLEVGAKEDGSKPLLVVSSTKGQDISIRESPNGDGMVQGLATFELEIRH